MKIRKPPKERLRTPIRTSTPVDEPVSGSEAGSTADVVGATVWSGTTVVGATVGVGSVDEVGGCVDDDGGTVVDDEEGGTLDGGADDGGAEEGGALEGGSLDGGAEEGGADDGGADDGGTLDDDDGGTLDDDDGTLDDDRGASDDDVGSHDDGTLDDDDVVGLAPAEPAIAAKPSDDTPTTSAPAARTDRNLTKLTPLFSRGRFRARSSTSYATNGARRIFAPALLVFCRLRRRHMTTAG